MSSASKDYLSSSHRIDFDTSLSPGKLVECKIIHDEYEESNMETPCSCCGSLKDGDHFVLLVDRLLIESTLEAAIKSERQLQQAMSLTSKDYLSSSHIIDFNTSLSPGKLVECKICHDEDEESNMETPCSCYGNLKVS
ncbi:e3 ubiquitin-protein ligase march8 [Fagus crenata]